MMNAPVLLLHGNTTPSSMFKGILFGDLARAAYINQLIMNGSSGLSSIIKDTNIETIPWYFKIPWCGADCRAAPPLLTLLLAPVSEGHILGALSLFDGQGLDAL